jgi:hypothetical protein
LQSHTGYLVSSVELAVLSHGSASSLQPLGKPLYPIPIMRFSGSTMQAPTWVEGSASTSCCTTQRTNEVASRVDTFGPHCAQKCHRHEVIVPLKIIVSFGYATLGGSGATIIARGAERTRRARNRSWLQFSANGSLFASDIVGLWLPWRGTVTHRIAAK